jgi:hypothetical protein
VPIAAELRLAAVKMLDHVWDEAPGTEIKVDNDVVSKLVLVMEHTVKGYTAHGVRCIFVAQCAVPGAG